jgi:hypothetical protein
MFLALHIVIALSSLVHTTYLYAYPSHRKLHLSYSLVAATLASGTYLVVSTHAPLVSSCASGLIYLGITTAGLLAARRKIALAL